MIKSLNPNASTSPDEIPPNSGNIICSYQTSFINNDLSCCFFPENAKAAAVIPIHKKESRTNKINYRTIKLVNVLSKVYEKFINNTPLTQLNMYFPKLISDYRKNNSSNRVLLYVIEDWKQKLGEGYLVGTVSTDLLKAFDCIPHDLLIAKLHAYDVDKNA